MAWVAMAQAAMAPVVKEREVKEWAAKVVWGSQVLRAARAMERLLCRSMGHLVHRATIPQAGGRKCSSKLHRWHRRSSKGQQCTLYWELDWDGSAQVDLAQDWVPMGLAQGWGPKDWAGWAQVDWALGGWAPEGWGWGLVGLAQGVLAGQEEARGLVNSLLQHCQRG